MPLELRHSHYIYTFATSVIDRRVVVLVSREDDEPCRLVLGNEVAQIEHEMKV